MGRSAIADRVAGTYERMLYVLSDGDPIYNASGSIDNFNETCTRVVVDTSNVVVAEFLRFKQPDGRASYEQFAAAFQPMLEAAGGEVTLSVRAEMPIVSEESWDHFVSFTFPSKDAMIRLYQSSAFNEINAMRIAGLDGTLAVLSTPQRPVRLTVELARESMQQKAIHYDRDGDTHYDAASALIKSILSRAHDQRHRDVNDKDPLPRAAEGGPSDLMLHSNGQPMVTVRTAPRLLTADSR